MEGENRIHQKYDPISKGFFSSNFFSLPELKKKDIQKSDIIAYTRTPHFQAQRRVPCQMQTGPLRSCLFYDLTYYMK